MGPWVSHVEVAQCEVEGLYVRGKNMVFLCLPMYCVYLNLTIWVISHFHFSRIGWIVFGIFGCLRTILSTCGNLVLAASNCCNPC